MSIIAFTGYKFSGKSYSSSILTDKYNYTKISFAGPLKKMVTDLFSLDDECYNKDKKEKIIPRLNTTPRKLLQIFGTELCRETLPKHIPNLKLSRKTMWESLLYDKVQNLRRCNPSINITVDDVRFDDEYQCIRDLGGIVIEIRRPSVKPEKSEHKSEMGCKADFVIINNGSLEQLEKLISVFTT